MDVRPGCLLRRSALGTDAVYRVLGVEGDLVEVQVVSAPGLEPGVRVRLALRDAQAMLSVDEATPTVDEPQPNPVLRAPE